MFRIFFVCWQYNWLNSILKSFKIIAFWNLFNNLFSIFQIRFNICFFGDILRKTKTLFFYKRCLLDQNTEFVFSSCKVNEKFNQDPSTWWLRTQPILRNIKHFIIYSRQIKSIGIFVCYESKHKIYFPVFLRHYRK